jgi:hypothetical protein
VFDHAAGLREIGWRMLSIDSHVRGLTDADLLLPRPANWGERRETRWLLSTLLQHDTYHAGEINRMRALLAGEDRWMWQIHAGIDPTRE